MRRLPNPVLAVALILSLVYPPSAPAEASAAGASVRPEMGPLRVLDANRRYFSDRNGKVVLLTGSHTWDSLQDYSYVTRPSPPPLDFDAYLAFLQGWHHNFFRLWVWESAVNNGALQGTTFFDPMPYVRPGPGLALDGKPKFDLSRFNAAYFDRMRTRIVAAGARGIYVSVMLFNGFSIKGKGNDGGNPWWGHPFNPRNNINGLGADDGETAHTLSNAPITHCQETYIRQVIDTVNDLDNVLFEISNEDVGSPANTAWQVHMIAFIKGYESTKPKQHPVGMTAQYPDPDNEALLASPADWISPCAKLPRGDGHKVVLNDTDHSYYWKELREKGVEAQQAWVWENFMRGDQCLFMDPYLDPSHDAGRNTPTSRIPDPYWDPLRMAMGNTREFAARMNLARMSPREDLSSTGFCLANPGHEYLVFQPQARRAFTLDLTDAPGQVRAEWFNVGTGRKASGDAIEGGAARTLTAPFEGAAVVYLNR